MVSDSQKSGLGRAVKGGLAGLVLVAGSLTSGCGMTDSQVGGLLLGSGIGGLGASKGSPAASLLGSAINRAVIADVGRSEVNVYTGQENGSYTQNSGKEIFEILRENNIPRKVLMRAMENARERYKHIKKDDERDKMIKKYISGYLHGYLSKQGDGN
ncbi:MAG: hypothetical protein Q8P57_05035 [Candidatus Pacearchaeota archaeon]|nr:hypothetical protein [Candidatus Pacearchaeota archaeon]